MSVVRGANHKLRTPNEGTNQRNLKFWADVADKICFVGGVQAEQQARGDLSFFDQLRNEM